MEKAKERFPGRLFRPSARFVVRLIRFFRGRNKIAWWRETGQTTADGTPLRVSSVSMRENVIVFLACLLAGSISLIAPFVTGQHSVVFSAAGVALAAFLWRGFWVLPGVALGGLSVQVLLYWLADSPAVTEVRWLPLLFAFAFCLQGWLGMRLMHHKECHPGGLDGARTLIPFLFMVTPLAAAAEPLLALVAFAVFNDASFGENLAYALLWWGGGMLSIMLVTPLLLSFWGTPRLTWRMRRWSVGIPTVFFIVLATVLLSVFLFLRQSAEAANFHAQAIRRVEILQQQAENHRLLLLASSQFLLLNADFDRRSFHRYLQPLLHKYPEVSHLIWAPLVERKNIAIFERHAAKASGERAYHVESVGADKLLFPALFIEPATPALLGKTILNLKQAQKALAPAVGRAWPGYSVIDEGELTVYWPIQGADEMRPPLGDMRGVLASKIDLAALVENLWGRRDVNMRWCLFSPSATADALLAQSEHCEQALSHSRNQALTQMLPVNFADQVFTLFLSKPMVLIDIRWVLLGGGGLLLLGGLASGFLLTSAGQARRSAELVARHSSEVARMVQSLKQQPVALSQMRSISRLGYWECQLESGEVFCSDEFYHLVNLPNDSPPDMRSLVHCFSGKARSDLVEALQAVRESGHSVGRDYVSGGRVLHIVVEGMREGNELKRLLLTAQDVTIMRKTEDEIRNMALYDPLTKLPNRSFWIDLAKKSLLAAQRKKELLAIMFIDLDHFKNINDSLGHAEGDRLLKFVAWRLGKALRQGDVLGRQGGDEFVIFLPNVRSMDNIREVASRILKELAVPLTLGINEFSVSASVGIAVYPDDGSDIDTLLQHADTAMYAAKADGRNSYRFFVQEMNDRVHQQIMLENGLRRAVREGEFSLHYQPQIECVSGKVSGVEALLRWKHPELGYIAPDLFIPIAENCGLIDMIGQWVMLTAFRQQREWAEQGYGNMLVAVNVSALQLARDDFVDQVRDLLEQTGADPHHIDLEITETAIRDANQALFDRMDALVDMGITLSLDDFGTGYSGLGALKGLPLHRIKLDRSFIRGLPDDIENAAITTASLAMARALGLDVVAEGVETLEHLEFLTAYSEECRFMQGYFFARPMTSEAFVKAYPLDRVV